MGRAQAEPSGRSLKSSGATDVAGASENRTGEDPAARWHIVQAAPQREIVVADKINRTGFEAYCPVERYRVRVNARKHREAARALFPGYLFVKFSTAGYGWLTLLDINYVRRILMVDCKPVPIPDAVIGAITIKERELYGRRRLSKAVLAFHRGQFARVLVGPLQGFFGYVVTVQGERLCVEFDLFGRKSRTWLRPDQLEAV